MKAAMAWRYGTEIGFSIIFIEQCTAAAFSHDSQLVPVYTTQTYSQSRGLELINSTIDKAQILNLKVDLRASRC